MTQRFNHGYALLIGVGSTKYPDWSLPVTVKDAQTLQRALTNPDLCAYPAGAEHVRLLHDGQATQAAILEGLAWLGERTTADPEATAVVYYSGHGWLDESTERYYLIPHDIRPFDIPGSALAAEAFTEGLRALPARRLLVIIDSCHAEGMATAKEPQSTDLPPAWQKRALPKGLVAALKEGEGRAVFTASRGSQRSWVRPDGTLSLYTYHLLEALQGAGNRPGTQVVRVSNLMNHLGQAVPQSARTLCQAEQRPFFDTATEDFPIALLRGGKGLPAAGWQAVQPEAEATIETLYQATLHGDGAIAQGEGATAVGAGGVHVGGNVGGDVNTGERHTLFDQRGQRVGRQTNVAGDFVGRDSIQITGDGNVIGDQSRSTVIKGSGGTEQALRGAFRRIYTLLATHPGLAREERADLRADLEEVEAELARGAGADPALVRRRLRAIGRLAPQFQPSVLALLADPRVGLRGAVLEVVESLR
jgi:hypothetical protein